MFYIYIFVCLLFYLIRHIPQEKTRKNIQVNQSFIYKNIQALSSHSLFLSFVVALIVKVLSVFNNPQIRNKGNCNSMHS